MTFAYPTASHVHPNRVATPILSALAPVSVGIFCLAMTRERRRLSDKELGRLAQYWLRAQLMRNHVRSFGDGKNNLAYVGENDWWEFETYLQHWLAALFTVVEGFNKLRVKNSRVQKLFNANIGALKQMRHETYHFVVEKLPHDATLFRHDKLNWAEELHDAIGCHIKEIVERRAAVDRLVAMRRGQ
jgi:hypothetical protein